MRILLYSATVFTTQRQDNAFILCIGVLQRNNEESQLCMLICTLKYVMLVFYFSNVLLSFNVFIA